MTKHTIQELKMRQALPLEAKISMTKLRIREFVQEFGTDGVYVSFSGGKDSTVLLHLVREIYPDVPAVFVDTGLEYPEIREFVKTFDNVEWLKPKMTFKQVINKYGYPFISKEISHKVGCVVKNPNSKYMRFFDGTEKDSLFSCIKYRFLLSAPFKLENKCCDIMKKNPSHEYERKTNRVKITGTMACESQIRTQKWLQNGCNAFEGKNPTSNPMSFWTEQDVLNYIKLNNIKIASVYGDIVPDYDKTEEMEGQMDFADLGLINDNRKLKTTGCNRTGCMFCGYGCHLEKSPNRFERMKETHPKQYEYIMKPVEKGGLGFKEVIDWINEHGNMNIKY